MKSSLRIALFIPLFATLLIAGVAATHAVLPQPSQPSVTATANGGELRTTWAATPGAQYYTVGWASNEEINQMTSVGREWFDAFHFTTIPASFTSHTISGLKPETDYYVIIGAQSQRFGAPDQVWSPWSRLVTTAGLHGPDICPITGLQIPEDGYLGVGDTRHWSDAWLRLDSATTPPSVPTADGSDYSPPDGRKLLHLCTTWSNQSGKELYYQAGTHNNLSTDRGIGFARVMGWGDFATPSGETYDACDTWSIPQAANVAVYAISNGSRPDVLFRIELSDGDGETTGSPSPVTTNTPLSAEELTRHVKPALAQIVTPDGSGTGFVVRSNGILVTNRHVVGANDNVTVYMQDLDGQLFEYDGRVLGRGILADLAVVQLPTGRTYPTLPLGDSDAVVGGTEVTAWGYPGGRISGTYPTITRGIISSKGYFDDVKGLQTDAAINPGNSGGPLIDQFGRVIGVNTAKISSERVDNIGFAITSNEVTSRLDTLYRGGPSQVTYQNIRFGFGYSIDIPSGWYLDRETRAQSFFRPYDRKGYTEIETFQPDDLLSNRSDQLSAFADWYANIRLPERAAEYWSVFQPISRTEVVLGGVEFHRLEYRRQANPDTCPANAVTLLSLSSSFPSKPYEFATTVSTCEAVLATHSAERERMLNSFRP